jgi:uncharacterized protein (TIGR02145 family)
MAVDKNGEGLAGVMLKIGVETKMSDNYGNFVFENIKVPKNRYYVGGFKDGYFDSGSGGIPQKGQVHYVRITLLSKGTAININSAIGGTITTNNNAQITFPVNAFTTLSGIPYNGDVRVFTQYISPDDSMFSLITPGGDLVALNQDNVLTQLISYGMTGVLIEDINGNELEIAPGKTAELKMPIAASQIVDAPADIPLLYFDTEKGIWVEEGSAIRSGNEFIGSVSHFSWWNCDMIGILPAIPFSGKVIDCNGYPLTGVAVTVNNSITTYTNSLGIFSNFVTSDTYLKFQVLSNHNGGIYPNSNIVNVVVGPSNSTVPDLVLPCTAWLSGNVKCNGAPASAYVWTFWNGGRSQILFTPSGNFKVMAPLNQNVSLSIANGQNNLVLDETSGPAGSNYIVDSINICGGGASAGCGGAAVVQDIDGNSYHVIQVGTKCWFKENLKVKRYSNGDSIQSNLSNYLWGNTIQGASSIYDTTGVNYVPHGTLYNWFVTVDPRGVCPSGWHAATVEDWNSLITTLDMNADTTTSVPSLIAGGMMKATGNLTLGNGLWYTPNTGATNLSGFSAVPSGFRHYGGTFDYSNKFCHFWSSEQEFQSNTGIYYELSWENTYIRRQGGASKRYGFAVRCVMD